MDIARTRSGVMIKYGAIDAQSFVKWALSLPFEDQFDIYCLAQWSFVRGRRQSISDDVANLYWEEVVESLEKSMPKASVSEEKLNLGLKSSVQMVDHGRDYSFHFWR